MNNESENPQNMITTQEEVPNQVEIQQPQEAGLNPEVPSPAEQSMPQIPHIDQNNEMFGVLYRQFFPYMPPMEQDQPQNLNIQMNYNPNGFKKEEEDKQKEEENKNVTLKFRENYIDLLVQVVSQQMEQGKITEDYLNTPINNSISGNSISDYSQKKGNLDIDLKMDEDKDTKTKKCDNKACSFRVDTPKKLQRAKFYAANSFKPKSMWLCEKCYKAYNQGHYCYYCNVIYRDFEPNAQYYDRKKWIQCDFCNKWQHIQCEQKKGKIQNIDDLLQNENFKYCCPFCRKDQENSLRSSKNKKNNKGGMINKKRKGFDIKKNK